MSMGINGSGKNGVRDSSSTHADAVGASQAKALKDLVKVASVFKLLQSGKISTMSEKEFERLMRWIDE